MRCEEFAGYRNYFIEDYSREISDNYGYSLEAAVGMAKAAVARDLPKGALTPGQELMCIEDSNPTHPELIGYLWYVVQENKSNAFILDFYLHETSRGFGHGKASIAELERKLVKDGIYEIKLRVAFDNNRALSLYRKSGFAVTGYNMIKTLPGTPPDLLTMTSK